MQDIKQLNRWLAFKVTPGNGKPEKRPLSLVTGGLASCSDPQTWCSWERAKEACAQDSTLVLGFALGKEVGLCVVDFDKVRKSTSEPWPEWALEEVERINSFTEISASGLGLHVLCWGSIPKNVNRQKLGTELWDSDKMFAFTGHVLGDRSRIYARDLSSLHQRVLAGQIGPDYKPKFIIYAYDTPKYRDIMEDNWTAYFPSRSDAVASALWTLARKHEFDPERMRSEFEASKICAAWGEKWERRGDVEIERAIAEVKARIADGTIKTAPGVQRLQFHNPEVQGMAKDFVLKATDTYDGWFPRSGVSLVAGSSGAGKTTLMLDLLDKQSRGDSYLGHKGAGFRFLSLFFDRGKFQNEETLERMGLLDHGLNIEYLPDAWDFGAAANVLTAIEQWGVPPVIFIEGADMLVGDANKVQSVSPFLGHMKDIAERYHTAVVLSVGAPKSKPNEQHALTRDRVFGSQIWARRAATVAYMMHVGDGSDGKRDLIVEHRNAVTEKFQLEYMNGLLVPRVDGAEVSSLETWIQSQNGSVAWDVAFEHVKDKYGLSKADFKRELKKSTRIEQKRTVDGLFISWKPSGKQ